MIPWGLECERYWHRFVRLGFGFEMQAEIRTLSHVSRASSSRASLLQGDHGPEQGTGCSFPLPLKVPLLRWEMTPSNGLSTMGDCSRLELFPYDQGTP